ncbi:GEVED domain-containing protein [Crocinitomicaceae bacterium]|nr:GEVED domain-containing protein [Crocinitomicaceae bacterium]
MKSLNSTFQCLFVSVIFSFFSFFSWTQSYTATSTSTNYLSASWVILSNAGDDDEVGSIPIGFDIPFFGTNYSTAYVSTNGWFSFIPPAGSWPTNSAIGSGTGPDGVIAPYWDDLRDNGGNDQLRYSIGGTAPNRYFAIDYWSFSWYCGGGYAYVQAVIYESGIIDFNYGAAGGTTWSDPACAGASIGIAQPGGGEFYCGANCGSTYNSGSAPQHYRFTPRPMISSLSASSICEGNTLTITGTSLSNATAVTIGGTSATITSNSATSIDVTVGSGTTGTVSVTTSIGTGTSSSSVTVNANPTPSASASVAGVCSGGSVDLTGTSGSSAVGSTAMNNSHCSPVANTSYAHGITNFSFNGDGDDINNTTSSMEGGQDYSSSIIATATPGSSAVLNMALDTDGSFYYNAHVWIDWNRDDNFDDVGEAYDMGYSYGNGQTSNTDVLITIPADASGYYKIRCMGLYISNTIVNISDQSCRVNGFDGGREDYKLGIIDTQSSTYAWASDVGGYTSSSQNPTGVSPAANTTYTVTETDGNSCTGTATVSVTANGLPSNSSVAISSNSTPPRNNDDITATISTSDPESAAVYSENDWRVDGSSFAVQNLSFDANGSDGLTSNSSQGGALTAYGDATQVAGVKGQAYEFDGVNDYLQNSSVNIDPSNGLSISLWQYTITTASSSGNDAYHQWVNLGPGQQMVLRNSFTNGVEAYVSTGGNLTGWCTGCGTGDFIYLTNQVSAGSWNHWVVTWNPDRTFKLYKNGTLIKTNVAAAGALSTITSLSISGNSAENFNGKIDELLVFERDISADQVTALYNSGTPSYSTIANDETSCGESWALSSNPVDAAGCSGSTTTSTAVSISGAQVTTADVTDVTTCGLDNYAIAIDDANDVGVWEVSPANAALIDDPSAPSTTVTASPTANPTSGFNSDLTFTWTPTDNNCASDNVMIKFNQPVITGTMDNYCWAWGGGTSDDWSSPSNWYKWDGSKWAIQSSSYPDAGSKVYILPTSSMCVTNGAINASASFEDLNIQGGSFDLGSANTSITGDIINNGGTLLAGSGTVTFNGSGAQSITGSGVNTNFNNLIINNSNGISSDIQIVVENELTMISGNIVNSSPLVLGSSSANSGILNHTTGIITGEFRRYFPNATGSQMFPVGTSSVMRDVSVNFTSAPGTDQYLTASYVTGAPTLFGGGDYEGLPLVTEDGQLIQNYDNEGHWVINPTNDDYSSSINGKAYTISLHMNNISDATDYTKTRIIKSAGSNTASQHHLSWGALTGQSVSGYNGAAPSNSNFAVTATSTGFSVFGAGSDDGDPLPVELVSFTGNCADGVVDVTWTTASEYNSSHFELENSRDGITWDVVYTKDAAGQSTELTEYTYNDFHANGGDNYYRLTQVDIDGTSKTYDVINASCSQTTSGYFSIFPNPSSGSFKVILNNAEIIGDARMNVVDTKGNIVLSKSLDVKSGINMYVVNEDLAPGIYYVSVENGDKVTVVLKHSVK